MMYFISGCKGTQIVLQGNVIHVTEVLQISLRLLASGYLSSKSNNQDYG